MFVCVCVWCVGPFVVGLCVSINYIYNTFLAIRLQSGTRLPDPRSTAEPSPYPAYESTESKLNESKKKGQAATAHEDTT